jgi:YfiH family protein
VVVPAPFAAAGEHIAIELPGARALFTTRRGGVSTGPFRSLNLGRLTGDDPGAVRRNRALLARTLGVTLAFGRQVHGSTVALVTAAPPDGDGARHAADGQATALRDVGLMVLTADCLPVAIAADGAAAMVHAGWQGLAGDVIAEGVRAVRELGGNGPLGAAIGPGAGPCCYAVGEELHERFAPLGRTVRNGANLDLKRIARIQLERAGVEHVSDCGLCTICSDRELFFSHRRDRGTTGRQAGVAWLT